MRTANEGLVRIALFEFPGKSFRPTVRHVDAIPLCIIAIPIMIKVTVGKTQAT